MIKNGIGKRAYVQESTVRGYNARSALACWPHGVISILQNCQD
jgi:hypothetical protein